MIALRTILASLVLAMALVATTACGSPPAVRKPSTTEPFTPSEDNENQIKMSEAKSAPKPAPASHDAASPTAASSETRTQDPTKPPN